MNLPKLMFFGLLVFFLSSTMTSNAQVTKNVYTRVLKIKAGRYTGTAFTIDVDGRQYLVTAKHLVSDLKQEGSINIYKGDQWSPTPIKVLRCEKPIDIAVLIPSKLLTQTLPLEPVSIRHQFSMGQDAYFVGFPFGLHMSVDNLNEDYPLALVKNGIFSALFYDKGAKGIVLDGFNNPGFSGGPIVFRDLKQPNSPLYVVGVISGFRPELSSVMIPEKVNASDNISEVEPWRIVKLKDGQNAILRDTEQFVKLNTGIVIGYSIEHAIDLIRKNPFGPKVAP